MSKKILVVGAMYSLNFGDGVICQTVSEIIKKELNAEPVIFGISGASSFHQNRQSRNDYEDKTSDIRNLYLIKRLRQYRIKCKLWKKLDCQASMCDAIVFAGGQLFMDCFVNYIAWIVGWAEKHNIRVIFNCCGIGKLSENSKALLDKVFHSECVQDISVRESTELFYQQFSSQIQTKRVCDPAMEVSSFHQRCLTKTGKIGIGLIHPINFRQNCVHINREQYLKILEIIVRLCRNMNVEFEFFTNGDPLDTEFCMQAMEALGCTDKMVPCPMSPVELVDTVTRYERIFSFRLHSHIIATSYGIPTAAFVWDEKVREFMKLIGREHRCISLMKMPNNHEISCVFSQLLHDDIVLLDHGLELTSQSLRSVLCDKD